MALAYPLYAVLTALLLTSACGGSSTENSTSSNNTNNNQPKAINGVDLSFSPEMHDLGLSFYDQNQLKPPIEILQQHGSNLVRLRLWVEPTNTYGSLQSVLSQAKQIQNLNMPWLLDVHFSDTWADPSHQSMPAAWSGQNYSQLLVSVESYTYNLIKQFEAQGTPPSYVQIGNEISCGLLWPLGHVCGEDDTDAQWQQLAGLIAAANRGIDAGSNNPNRIQRILHFDNGVDNAKSRWFFDHLQRLAVRFDLIGLSYYPWWHGDLAHLAANLNDLATRYQKPLLILETAYPWTLAYQDSRHNLVGETRQLLAGYPATPTGQAQFLRDLWLILRQVPQNLGAGLIYWAPDWLANTASGSAYENLSLFDFQGQLLPAAKGANSGQ